MSFEVQGFNPNVSVKSIFILLNTAVRNTKYLDSISTNLPNINQTEVKLENNVG